MLYRDVIINLTERLICPSIDSQVTLTINLAPKLKLDLDIRYSRGRSTTVDGSHPTVYVPTRSLMAQLAYPRTLAKATCAIVAYQSLR